MKCERGSWLVQGLIICLAFVISHGNLQADAIDESSLLQNVFDEALLDLHGGRWSPAMEENLRKAREQFGQTLTNPEARELWNQPFPVAVEGLPFAAEAIGFMQARLQHVAALEMISNQRAGNIRGRARVAFGDQTSQICEFSRRRTRAPTPWREFDAAERGESASCKGIRRLADHPCPRKS